MAIESVSGNTPNVPLPAKPAAKDVSGNNKSSATSSVTLDVVSFSSVTLDLKNAVTAGGAGTDINEDRVTVIKAAIISGQYQPNPERIAGKMMQFEKLLANST